ncbi:MAG: hypothetical protein QGI45_01600, partial [Myxococcota bacterium]|nr:hypothetical protein [Myxococcota bacterium]
MTCIKHISYRSCLYFAQLFLLVLTDVACAVYVDGEPHIPPENPILNTVDTGIEMLSPVPYASTSRSSILLEMHCPSGDRITLYGPGIKEEGSFVCRNSPVQVNVLLSADIGVKTIHISTSSNNAAHTIPVVRVDAELELPSFTQSKALFSSFCINCHSGSEAPIFSFDDLHSQEDFFAWLVRPGAPAQSPLYQSLQFADFDGIMPQYDQRWRSEFTYIIQTWIEQSHYVLPPDDPPDHQSDNTSLNVLSPQNYAAVVEQTISLEFECPLSQTVKIMGSGVAQSQMTICNQSPQSIALELSSGLGTKEIILNITDQENNAVSKVV